MVCQSKVISAVQYFYSPIPCLSGLSYLNLLYFGPQCDTNRYYYCQCKYFEIIENIYITRERESEHVWIMWFTHDKKRTQYTLFTGFRQSCKTTAKQIRPKYFNSSMRSRFSPINSVIMLMVKCLLSVNRRSSLACVSTCDGSNIDI